MTRNTRILALDGGGIWALIQAKALGSIYGFDTPGQDILRRFRFVFANSGGSIVLAGLIANKSPAAILAILTSPQEAARMFDRKRLFWLRRLVPFLPRYRTSSKQAMLRAVFGNTELKTLDPESKTPTYFVIVSFDFDRERAFFFRSRPSLRTSSVDVLLADAVHASSTAPVRFFDAPAEITVRLDGSEQGKTMHFWDGAVTGLNNPVAAAVAEALSVQVPADDIAVLSLGTGNVVLPNTRTKQTVEPDYVVRPTEPGLLATLTKLAQSVIGDPPDFASFLAHASLGGRTPPPGSDTPVIDGPVVRLNPLVTPIWTGKPPEWDTPSGLQPDEFKRLIELEIDATAPDEIALISRFADLWLAGEILNQPIRLHFRDPERGLVAEIGHSAAPAALLRWDELDPDAPAMRSRAAPLSDPESR
jgi:patatin-like phospholipase/acyl hydrolase